MSSSRTSDPGRSTRLGLDYASLKDARPKLIYCVDLRLRTNGAAAIEAGYDAVIQAEGGLMSITGDRGRPSVSRRRRDRRSGRQACWPRTGSCSRCMRARQTGRGQQVDIGMLDGVVSILSYHASMHLTANIRSRRVGNRHATIAPYDTFARGRRRVLSGGRQRRSVPPLLRGRRSRGAARGSEVRDESRARREPHRAARAARRRSCARGRARTGSRC